MSINKMMISKKSRKGERDREIENDRELVEGSVDDWVLLCDKLRTGPPAYSVLYALVPLLCKNHYCRL